MSSGHSFHNDRSGTETAEHPVDVRFATTEAERRLQNVRWTFALQRPKRSGDCRTSGGRSLCNDRSGAETSNLRVPAGLENTKKMVSNWIPSFCVSLRARDGTRTRGLDLGKVALHQLSHSRKERVMGIEPTYPAWKAGVLPLNYTRRLFNCCCLVKTCL